MIKRGLGAVCLLLPWLAQAAVISVVPSQGDFVVGEGGGTTTLTLEVIISDLHGDMFEPAGDDFITDYDIGLAYDPAVLSLASFDGFSNFLGNEGAFEVLNAGPLDAPNNSFDYTADSTTFGAYNDTVVGSGPVAAMLGGISFMEGSLRFTQSSLLDPISQLDTLQPDSFILFSLTFDVDTTVAQTSEILLVDDTDYVGFTGNPAQGELDQKYNDPQGGTPPARYAVTTDASIRIATAQQIPLPSTLLLMLCGVLAIGERYKRRF